MPNTRDLIDPMIYSRIRPAVAKQLSDRLQHDVIPSDARRTLAEWEAEVVRLNKEVSDCYTAYESSPDKRKAVSVRRKWEAYCVRLIIAEAYHKYHVERLLAVIAANKAVTLSFISWNDVAEKNLKEAKEALAYWETNTPKDAEEEEKKINDKEKLAKCVIERDKEHANHFKNVALFMKLNAEWLGLKE